MPKDLYLTLVNGRTIHVTNDWDGMEPTYEGLVDAAGDPDDGKGIETGEYYRDMHRYKTDVTVVNAIAKGQLSVQAALLPATVAVDTTPGISPGFTFPLATNVANIALEPSDEVAKVKPRTWQKVCTWLVFNCVTTNHKRKWRAASVDGFSDQPPIDD